MPEITNNDKISQSSDKNSLKTSKIKKKPRTRKITPKQEAILAAKSQNPNATGTEIAKQCGTDISYTIEVLQRFGLTKQSIQDYKDHKTDILTGLQARILSTISQADIEKASLHQRIIATGILHDKEQDMRGNNREVQPMVVINQISVRSDKMPVEGISGQGQIIDVIPVSNNAQCPEIESLKNKPLDIIRESTESK